MGIIVSVALSTSCSGDEAPMGSPITGEIDQGIVTAITEYMATSGLGGDVLYILTHPPDCSKAFPPQTRVIVATSGLQRAGSSTTNGLICVLKDKSTMSADAATIFLALDGMPTYTWKLDLKNISGTWQVKRDKFTGQS